MKKDEDTPVALDESTVNEPDETPEVPQVPEAAEAAEVSGRGGESSFEAFVSGAAYAALGLLGAIVGLLGSFAQEWTVGSVPAAAIALVVLNFGVIRLSAWAMGGRLGGVIPALLWTLVVLVMSVRRPEGDLVVPGTLAGYLFIIGGMTAAVIAVSLQPTRRPPGDWLTGGIAPLARR